MGHENGTQNGLPGGPGSQMANGGGSNDPNGSSVGVSTSQNSQLSQMLSQPPQQPQPNLLHQNHQHLTQLLQNKTSQSNVVNTSLGESS